MKFKSDILEMIHENASANFAIGAISEARMREYDEMCLVPEAEASAEAETGLAAPLKRVYAPTGA